MTHLKNIKNQYVIYYDFKGAFDTPAHKKLFEEVMPQRGFSEKIIKLIRWVGV
jgi:hypothetical protein